MKKRFIFVGVFILLCLLGGCIPTTPLTDEEMDVVAEYAASLLLKYDEKYATPLFYEQELEGRLTPTPTPVSTPVPEKPLVTPTPTPGAENSATNNNGSQVAPTATPTVTPTPTPTPAMYNEAETSRQLTDIIAVKDITVTCDGYELKKSVQSTEYFSLVAKEGRQYAVVNFLLYNNTAKDIVFDASENGLEYSIDINTGTVSRVSLSMLENDLQYMAINVPAKGTAPAVLVFEIADEEITTMHLIIENESEDTVFAKLK